MAQFLQDTIEEMALKSSSKSKGDAVREFAEFFEQVRPQQSDPLGVLTLVTTHTCDLYY